MSEAEMLQRISDLETALRIVIFLWVLTVVGLASLIQTEDDPQDPRPRCPMCFKRHYPNERCP